MFLRKLVNNSKDQVSFLTHALLVGQWADCLYMRLLHAKHPCNMSRTSGGKKGTPPAQAVRGHLTQRGTLSDSLRQDTTCGRGPSELLKHKERKCDGLFVFHSNLRLSPLHWFSFVDWHLWKRGTTKGGHFFTVDPNPQGPLAVPHFSE